ncbi:MAG: hypothetical protein H7841_02480 [Magnetospirillum sp. WYHS-4]
MVIPAAPSRPARSLALRATVALLAVASLSSALVYLFCPELLTDARNRSGDLYRHAAAIGEDFERGVHKLREAAGRLWAEDAAPVAPARPEPPVLSASPAMQAVVLWHDAEAVSRRGQVDTGDFNEFVAALRRTMDEDRARLRLIAAEHLRAELEPALALLPARIPAFAEELFTYSTSAGLLYDAIAVTDGAIEATARPAAVERTHGEIVRGLVQRYRKVVLSPEVTLGPVRNAIGRAYGALRRDLLSNCDRYDRAFRDFLKSHAAGIEVLDNASGWRPDPIWSPENATFRSLCHTLRMADGGHYVVDEKMLAELADPSMAVHELLSEISRPIADIAVEAAVSTAGAVHFLEGFGLPASWAYVPARATGLAVSNWAMAWQVLDRMDAIRNRPKLETHLREALQGARAAITEKALMALIEFVSLRLDGMESVIAARSEGGRFGR